MVLVIGISQKIATDDGLIYSKQNKLIGDIKTETANLQDLQREFLLRKNIHTAEQFEAKYDDIIILFYELRNGLKELKMDVSSINPALLEMERYKDLFSEVAIALTTIGLNTDSGYKGLMKNELAVMKGKLSAIPDIDLLNELKIMEIVLESHFENWTQRSNDKIEKHYRKLSISLENKKREDPDRYVPVISNLESFRRHLLEVNLIAGNLGFTEDEGYIGKMSQSIIKVNDILVTSLNRIGNSLFIRDQKRSTVVILLVLAATILLTVFSYWVVQEVGSPANIDQNEIEAK